MQRKIIRIISLIILLTLMLSIQISAAETRSSPIIVDYGAVISEKTSGDLSITFWISTSEIASKLGASKITLQYRESGTTTWHTAYTYALSNYPELQASNKSFYRTSVSYSTPQSGYEYRAYVSFYASKGTVSDTKPYTTAIWP